MSHYSCVVQHIFSRVSGSLKRNVSQRIREISLASVTGLAAITGCTPTAPNNPNFFVSSGGNRERSTFVPTGGGWIPSSEIEITLVAEPKRTPAGELFAENPHLIGTVHADSVGMFGFNSGAFNHVVVRSICGAPPDWLQTPFFIARDKLSGLIRTSSVDRGNWFTFEPCQ